MPYYSDKSKRILETCHPDIQKLFNRVIVGFDCTIFSGHRDKDEQDELYRMGRSKLTYPNSDHNREPSDAVDVVAYPANWEDVDRQIYFAGYVKGVASALNIPILWGGDWNDDTQIRDTKFRDYYHFARKQV